MIKILKASPLFDRIITTMEIYKPEDFGSQTIIDVSKNEGTVKEYQKVISVGSTVRSVKPGDLVCINPSRYEVRKQVKQNSIAEDMNEHYKNQVVGYNFPTIEMDGKDYLLIHDSDIMYIVDEFVEEKQPIIQKQSLII